MCSNNKIVKHNNLFHFYLILLFIVSVKRQQKKYCYYVPAVKAVNVGYL